MTDMVHIHPSEELLDFLSGVEAVEFAKGFVKTYGLPDTDVARVMQLAEDVAYKVIPLERLVERCASQFHLDQIKAKRAALEIAEKRLLPIESFVENVREAIRTWGGELPQSSNAEGETPQTPASFVHAIVRTFPGNMPAHLQNRLEHFLTLYVSKHSDRTQIVDMLTRADKVGGLAFDVDDAKRMLDYFDEKMTGVSFDDGARGRHISDMKQETRDSLEDAVKQICEGTVFRFDDPKQQERCKQIVASRLREVRGARETQAQLERPFEQGGLGVSGRMLVDMMQMIEKGVGHFLKETQEKIAKDRSVYVEQKKQLTQNSSVAQKEQKVMTKRYVELTGKLPKDSVLPTAPSGARVSASVSATQALLAREQKIDANKVRQIVEAAAKSASPSSSTPAARPAMQDVVFTRRLSGPIDVLRAMTLVDFRRLSKDAASCAQKVKDQVGLMEEEGFDRKVEAIRAWQSSPLYQVYLTIARMALQEGTSLEEVRRAQESQSGGLTKQELSEIIKLNSDLRF